MKVDHEGGGQGSTGEGDRLEGLQRGRQRRERSDHPINTVNSMSTEFAGGGAG